MEKISPLLLYSAAIDLQNIHSLIREVKKDAMHDLVTADDCVKISQLMARIRSELLKLNCPVAAKFAAFPDQLMETNSLTYDAISRILEDVDKIIRVEVETTYAFSLNLQEAAFFDPAEPMLGQEVTDKFECCSFDIDEASKCLALGRATGAVFHAFRVLEIGIKALAKCLSVKDLEKPKMRNWGFILDGIKTAIEAKWPTDKDRDDGDGQLFWEAYTLMLAIKVPRNGTMHPARKYTEQEADRMLGLIGDVMKVLAGRMNEQGEPKA